MSRRRLFPFILAVLLVVGLASAATQAQQETISLDEYRARLAAALETLQRGESPTLPSTPVRLPSGDSIVPAPIVLQAEGDTSVTRARISIAIEQTDLSANDNTTTRLAQLEQVADGLDLLQPTLWERFTRWLWGWIDRLLPDSRPIAGGAVGNVVTNVVGWAVIGVGGLLMILLFSYWLRRLFAGLLTGQSADGPLAVAGGMPASAVQARQQAAQLAESGNYREAVRRLYLAALLRLRERKLIRFDDSLTNREVLAMVATGSTQAHLATVVDTFDRVWYGEREPDDATFRAYSREIDALLGQTNVTQHGNRDHA